jgi:DNA-binding MarR family transcriptional regulator
LYGATVTNTFPDDELRRGFRQLVRMGGLLEPHDHAGVHLTLSEVMAVGELLDQGAMSQQRLAELLGLEKSTVSRLAAGLERRGWVARERVATNRRFYELQLTEEGRRVAELIAADLRAHHDRLLGRLTPAERHGLAVGLAGLSRALHDHAPHAGVDRSDPGGAG